MESSTQTLVSPPSDDKLWSKLRDRVDTILGQQSPKPRLKFVESERGKRQREDSLLLIRGLDSAAASLSQLTQSLDAAQQGLTSLRHKVVDKPEQNETEPNPKRHCGSSEPQQKDEEETALGNDSYPDESKEEQSFIIDVTKSGTLKKARNMAINLASKAAALASELKAVKSELCSVQGRCKLLEEENRRLRDGLENVVRPDEDDLVTLQLEALLAEKSKLANENANLVRENECLRQLVEYHQLAHEDDITSPSSSSYEEEEEQQSIHGVRLDFEDCVDECKERT